MSDFARYVAIRKMRWPALLITLGVTALLAQFNLISYEQSWPLYLIVFGLFKLAENLALSAALASPQPPSPYAEGQFASSGASRTQAAPMTSIEKVGDQPNTLPEQQEAVLLQLPSQSEESSR